MRHMMNAQTRIEAGSVCRAKLNPTSLQEILKYIGLRLMMVRMRLDQLADYWSETPVNFCDAPRFGHKYGMSRNRFLDINKHLTFWPATETDVRSDFPRAALKYVTYLMRAV
jgi:hypothetical protein